MDGLYAFEQTFGPGKFIVTLSRSTQSITHACSKTAWRKATIEERLDQVTLVDVEAPYLIKVHRVREATIPIVALPNPLCLSTREECAGMEWAKTSSLLHDMVERFGTLYVPAGDAFFLCQNKHTRHLFSDSRIVVVNTVTIPCIPPATGEILSIANKLQQSYNLLGAAQRQKVLDTLTSLNVKTQLDVSKSLYPTEVHLQSFSANCAKACAAVALGAAATYGIFSLAQQITKRVRQVNHALDVSQSVVALAHIILNEIRPLMSTVTTMMRDHGISPDVLLSILGTLVIGYCTFDSSYQVALLGALSMMVAGTDPRKAIGFATSVCVWWRLIGHGRYSTGEIVQSVSLQSAGEKPLSSTPAVVGLLAMFLGLSTIKVSRNFSTNFVAFLAAATSTKRFYTSFQDLIDWVLQIAPIFAREVLALRNPFAAIMLKSEHLFVVEEVEVQYLVWHERWSKLCPDDVMLDLAANSTVRRSFIDIMKQAFAIRDIIETSPTLLGQLKYRNFISILRDYSEKYRVAVSIEGTPKTVLVPYTLWVSGPSGIGKSSLISIIAEYIFGSGQANVYSRNSNDPFTSGYNRSHNTFVFDDFAGVRAPDVDDAAEFFRMVTPAPYRINMPDISTNSLSGTKGLIFASPLMICCANTHTISSQKVPNNEALSRRRKTCIELRCKAQYRKEGTGHTDWEKVRAVVQDGIPILEALEGVRYEAWPPIAPHMNKCLSMTELLVMIRKEFVAHIKDEIRRVRFESEVNIDPALPLFDLTAFTDVHLQSGGEQQATTSSGHSDDEHRATEDASSGPFITATQLCVRCIGLPVQVIAAAMVERCPNLIVTEAHCACGVVVDHLVTPYCVFKRSATGEWQQTEVPAVDDNSRYLRFVLTLCRVAASPVLLGVIGYMAHLAFKYLKGGEGVQLQSIAGRDGDRSKRAQVKVKRPKVTSVRLQADKTTVVDTITTNMVLVTVTSGTNAGIVRRAQGLFLAGRAFLMPEHLLKGISSPILTIAREGLFSQQINAYGQPEAKNQSFTFAYSDCKSSCLMTPRGSNDLLIVQAPISVRLFPSILHLIQSQDNAFGDSIRANFIRQRMDHSFVVLSTIATEYPNSIHSNEFGGTDVLEDVYAYMLDTRDGDCCAPIITNRGGMQDYIIGVHVATKADGASFALAIYRENLLQALKSLEETQVVWQKTVPSNLKPTGVGALIGDFDVHGYASNFVPQMQTKLQRSVFAGVISTSDRRPAILNSSDERWAEIRKKQPALAGSPLARAVGKYGKVPSVSMSGKVLGEAADAVRDKMRFVFDGQALREFTICEALNGANGLPPMDVSTSPGLPHTDKSLRRCDLITGDVGAYQPTPEFSEDIHRLRQAYGNGEVGHVMWKDFTKDELLSEAKISHGKTRHITCCPLEFYVLVRQLFGDFETRFKNAPIFTGSAVGLVCESEDWDQLYKYLHGVGPRGWCGDYSNFDGTIPAEVISQVTQLMASFYPSIDKVLLRGVTEDLIHAVARCDTIIYSKHIGNPSGCPITTTLNTLSNLLMIAYAILKLPAGTEQMYRCSAIVAYGDDLIIVPCREMSDAKIDLNCISSVLGKFGVKLNSELKTLWKKAPIDTFVFLRRAFHWDGSKQLYVPLLAWSSVADMVNWTRANNEVADVTMATMRVNAAQLALYFYGAETFERFTRMMQKRAIQNNVDVSEWFHYEQLTQMFWTRELSAKFALCTAG